MQIKFKEREDFTPPVIPVKDVAPEKEGQVGIDFCQICGGKTKLGGGNDAFVEEWICRDCGTIHMMRIMDKPYKGGKPQHLVLESIA
jgi:hypothetical protein